jgi:hypothetical protein
MAQVWSFQPRSIDDPFFILEREDDLHTIEGESREAEQCDRCGGTTYTLRQLAGGRWRMVCTPQDGMPEGVGCGAEYAVELRDEEEVVF